MYVVTQLYHDYNPKGDCQIDSQFVDMYNVIGLFKTFDKAVERAKQINKDFEMDCSSRLHMKYEDLKKAINNYVNKNPDEEVDFYDDFDNILSNSDVKRMLQPFADAYARENEHDDYLGNQDKDKHDDDNYDGYM